MRLLAARGLWGACGLLPALSAMLLSGALSAQVRLEPGVAGELPTREQLLLRELARRDAVIASLIQRLERLEQQVSVLVTRDGPAAAGRPAAADSAPGAEPGAAAPGVPEPAAGAAGQPEVSAREQAAQTEPAVAAPGQFEVEPDAIDRALERTLVETGVLLLPFGKAEVRPAFSYARRESDALVLLTDLEDDRITGRSEVERNLFDLNVGLRVGLPLDSQLELQLPYRIVEESRSRFPDLPEQTQTGSGLGDISVGLAKTLLMEGPWWPDLIARLAWDTASGERRDDGVALSGGFNEISASLSALKRQDPLAFTGTATYETAFERDGIEPGDALSFSLGAILAASPETSLRVALNQTFADDLKVDGRSINGTDQVSTTLTLGAAAVLGRGVLIDVSGDVGLTDDAPDYAARVALPIRFDLPIPAALR
jgi:hypothetical protein